MIQQPDGSNRFDTWALYWWCLCGYLLSLPPWPSYWLIWQILLSGRVEACTLKGVLLCDFFCQASFSQQCHLLLMTYEIFWSVHFIFQAYSILASASQVSPVAPLPWPNPLVRTLLMNVSDFVIRFSINVIRSQEIDAKNVIFGPIWKILIFLESERNSALNGLLLKYNFWKKSNARKILVTLKSDFCWLLLKI